MTNAVAVLMQSSVHGTGKRIGAGVWVWCPGCVEVHRFQVVGNDGSLPDGPKWEWNENLESPTFEPSYLTWHGDRENPTSRCHSYLRNGIWEFLSDCTHALAGQHVSMVPVPDWLLPKVSRKFQRGNCSVCNQEVSITKAGLVWPHYSKRSGSKRCRGTRQPPQ